MAQILSPLAQSFFIDVDKYPNGVFVKTIGLYFKSKDAYNATISVQLRPMINGFPSNDTVYPFATATIDGNSVKVRSPETVASMPTFADPFSETVFSFPAPVYLLPGEHSIVIQTNSKDYELYLARMGEPTLLNSEIKIATQPYTGVLFKSSNGFTYTPEQNEDLMFRLGVCNFTTNTFGICRMMMKSNTNGDIVNPTDVFKFVPNHTLINNTGIDYYWTSPGSEQSFTKFATNVDVSSSSPIQISSAVSGSLLVEGAMHTTDKYVSPVMDELHSGAVVIKNIIGAGEIGVNNIVLTNSGSNYGPTISVGGVGSGAQGYLEVQNGVIIYGHVTAAGSGYGASLTNIPVTITANGFGSGGVITAVSNSSGNIIGFNITNGGSDYGPVITVSDPDFTGDICVLGCNIGSSDATTARKITKINLIESGSGYYLSPTITINNSGGPGSGLALQINLEDKQSGGNCLARYITKQVQLNFDSTSLKVFFDAHRPAETEIRIFAKFLNRDDVTNIRESEWQELSLANEMLVIPTPRTPTTFNEVAFELNNISYDKTIDGSPNNFIGFNSFKVKICMYSKSTSIVPKIKNFRAVAVK